MEKTIFEKIIDGEIPCDKVFENERILAFHDISPQAPVHIILVPKKHLRDIASITEEDHALIGEIVTVANALARQFKISEGYRLLTNNGPNAGQSIFHLHFHLVGGRPLGTIA